MKAWMIAVLVLFAGTAWADGNGNNSDPCSHPVFVTHECLASQQSGGGQQGEQGPQGERGEPGAMGIGKQGPRGPRGFDGADGVVPTDWIDETRARFGRMERYLAASAALDIDLPQNGNHRLSVMGSNVSGTTGVGVGYAYRDEDGVALKLGVATAGQDTSVVQLGVSWEF